MWHGSTGDKRCGVALTSATTPAPVRNLSPSWVVSLSVATSFHTTSLGGTVSRLYMCKSVKRTLRGTQNIPNHHTDCIYSKHLSHAYRTIQQFLIPLRNVYIGITRRGAEGGGERAATGGHHPGGVTP